MVLENVYLAQGVSLLITSLFVINLLLNESSRDYLNAKHDLAYFLSYLVSFGILVTWISGVYYYTTFSPLGRYMMVFSAELFWIILFVGNLVILRFLWSNGIRINSNHSYANFVFYFAVLWLLSRNLPMSYPLLFALSTICSILILYFIFLLRKYLSLVEVFVVPVDVYKFFLSFSIVSVLFSLLMLARMVEIRSYLFFAIVIYVVLLLALTFLIREIRPIVSKA